MKHTKVLVSDDQELWRENVLAALLRSAGYCVKTASTIDETLGILDKEFFHVIIADICFSLVDHHNTDGVRTVQRVARLDEGSSTIVLTGYGTVQLAVQALREHSVFHFLEKGEAFDQQRFLEVIREASRTAEIGQVHRQGSVPFESVVGEVNLQQASSQLQIKQTTLRWLIMNLVNQVWPVVLGPHLPTVTHGTRGYVFQRPLWSRFRGDGLVMHVGKKNAIQPDGMPRTDFVATAEMDDALGILVADDSRASGTFPMSK